MKNIQLCKKLKVLFEEVRAMNKSMRRFLMFSVVFLLVFPLFTSNKVEAAEWKKDSFGWWWQENDNSYPVSSWKKIGGKWYYFDENGYMLDHGWHWIDGKCYYMYAGGAMASSEWIDGSYVDSSGAWVANQWISNSDGWWYRYGDGSYPANKWEQIGGKRYYFDKNGYMLEQGWHWINGKCYYMYSDGSMASDTWIDGSYVDSSGAWVTDQWIYSSNRWWYRHADGSFTSNDWEYIGGKWYHFDASGWMQTGWIQMGKLHYYLDESGAMVTSCWIGDYYLQSDGSMAVNQWIGEYWVDADGKWNPGVRKPQYSYEIYSLKPFETVYSGCMCMVYLKTDRPDLDENSYYDVRGVGSSWNYDDVWYTYEDNIISYIEKVEGGYLISVDTDEPGISTLEIYENNVLVAKADIKVEDYSAANDAYMDYILSEVTTPDMSPVEKMDKVADYLLDTNKYTTCFEDKDGGGYAYLLTEEGPWFVCHQLNSYSSPALLCQFAEKIGGFESIHNCYGDYPYGTSEWYQWHYTCKVTYQGEEYDFRACPFWGNLVDRDTIEYVSFAPGSEIFGERLW